MSLNRFERRDMEFMEKKTKDETDGGNIFISQVLTTTIDMERKGEATVRIRPTIPYITPTLELPLAGYVGITGLPISLNFPDNNTQACSVKGGAKQCEINIPSILYPERHKYQSRRIYGIKSIR